jgi:hypothetical protein
VIDLDALRYWTSQPAGITEDEARRMVKALERQIREAERKAKAAADEAAERFNSHFNSQMRRPVRGTIGETRPPSTARAVRLSPAPSPLSPPSPLMAAALAR